MLESVQLCIGTHGPEKQDKTTIDLELFVVKIFSWFAHIVQRIIIIAKIFLFAQFYSPAIASHVRRSLLQVTHAQTKCVTNFLLSV